MRKVHGRGVRAGVAASVLAVGVGGLGTIYGPASASQAQRVAAASPTAFTPAGRLVFRDEFNGTRLGPAWNFRDVQPDKRACSPPDRRGASVGSGKLKLTMRLDSTKKPNKTKACPDGQFRNAMIGTEATHTFRYGTFAARIKFPKYQGGHGSFWMQPAATSGATPGNAATNGTEIDVVEYFGSGRRDGGTSSFVYYPRTTSGGTVQVVKAGGIQPEAKKVFGKKKNPSNGYHTYSVDWSPTQYVFRYDGVEVYRLKKGVSKVPEYLILSLLSSDYELPRLKKGALPMSMYVDWVRVYQK